MAARRNLLHSERVRDRIKATQLANALQDNVLSRKTKGGKKADFMSANQIQCARILLAKVVPDVQRTELTGKDGKDLSVIVQAANHDDGL